MKTAAKNLTLLVVGAVIAVLGDYTHVISKTTFYRPDQLRFKILESAWWFVAMIALGVPAIPVLYQTLEKKRWPPRSVAVVILAILAYLGLYALSGFLPWSVAWNSAIMFFLAYLFWQILRPNLSCFIVGVIFAAVGVAIEITVAHWGLAGYFPRANQLFGVAPWLPALYFASVPVIVVFAESSCFHSPRENTLKI